MSQHVSNGSSALRVLLAEDDENSRLMYVEQLRHFGHTVVAAVTNGRDAVRHALESRPDVAILDFHMPNGSGVDAAREIARAVPGSAIVLLTGDRDATLSPDDVSSTMAVAFLHKPVSAPFLDTTVRLAATRVSEITSARREAESAKSQLEARKLIERAKGILMRRTNTSEQEAYRIMQRSSQDKSMPMVKIAEAVLASEPN
jgi:response regulator NasT